AAGATRSAPAPPPRTATSECSPPLTPCRPLAADDRAALHTVGCRRARQGQRERVCRPALRSIMAGSDESATEIPPDACACAACVERPLFALASVSRGTHRPARLVARLGEGGTARALPRGDRRRRRSWTGDRLLPRHRVRHQRRRGAGAGPSRAGQRRAQHDHHPFQLLPPAEYPLLRALAQAAGRARAASEAGVDIVEDCEVTGIARDGSRVTGVETTRGHITADTVCLAVAGHSSRLAAMAGLTLPIESHVLQAFVSEGIKPVLDVVLTYGAGHFYVSQSDKGGLVFGGAIDGYNTYGQRGTLPMAEEVAAAAVTLLPGLARLKVLRQWGGVMDMSMDGSPIISATPLE